MPPTLQSIRDAILDGAGDSFVYGQALNWVDAGCPRLTDSEAAVLQRVAAMDLDSPEFWRAVRAYRQEPDRNKSPTPAEEGG